jgi:hypothetical protein
MSHVDQRVDKALGIFKNHNLKSEIGHKRHTHPHANVAGATLGE